MNLKTSSFFTSRLRSIPIFSRIGSPKITALSGIIPRRSISSRIISTPTLSADEERVDASRGVVSSLGRLTLNLEVISNNLDRIKEIIVNDYKETQETNKKEIDDYRKRVANRGRIFGKKELGDRKTDILGGVRKYVGSFFSGVGGSIRALASFNLLQALMTGDVGKVIQSLLGIGLTYLPTIGAGIAGAVATSLVGKIFGRGGAAAATAAAEGAAGAGRLGRFGRIGGTAALVGGGLALANSIFNRSQGDSQQQRLEDLTKQQKGLTDPQSLVPIPEDDLKKFERLNKKFEEALDFLMGGRREQQTQPSASPGGGSTTPSNLPGQTGVTIQDSQQALSELGITQAQFDAYKQGVADVEGARYNQMGGAGRRFAGRYQMGQAEIASAAAIMGMPTPTQQEFLNNPELQEKIFMDRTILMNRIMMNRSPKYAGMSPTQKMIALAGSQLGEGNLTNFLERGMSISDSAGVGIQRWMNAVQRRMSQTSSGLPQAPVLPPPLPTPRTQPNLSSPSTTPNIEVVPFPVGGDSPEPSSAAVESNDDTPSIDTTYSDNFLALYSRLIYQIV